MKVGVVSTNPRVAIINSYPGPTNLTDPICITLCTKTAELERGMGLSTRFMSTITGEPRLGTLINWTAFDIPANNAANSGINLPQINESAFIQTPEGSLNISGTYDDSNFNAGGSGVTSIPSAIFKGRGTGKWADVSLVRIVYDNDGSILTGGNVKGLRKLALYSETYIENN